jgi:hypothetical protein
MMNVNAHPTDKEILSTAERWLEGGIVILLLLLFGYFAVHQLANTGLFTAKFGTAEMLCLYVPIFVAMIAPVVRAQTGQRNPARLWMAASTLLTAATGVWLLLVFPFNFAHFADILPGPIRFMFFWLTDDIARIPLALQIIIGPISAIMAVWQYVTHGPRQAAPLSH